MNLKCRLAAQVLLIQGLLGATGTALAQNWVSQSDMNVARVEATTIDYGNSIYVFNGFKEGIVIADSVEKYDVATQQWEIISNTSVGIGNAVTHNGAVRIGAEVWIIGGRVGSHPGRVSDKVFIYNLDTNNWRTGPDLPEPGAAGGAALVNNKVHWFGGLDSQASCDVGNHFIYDLDSPSSGWQDITSSAAMPSPRNHFATAVVDGIIYAMGGQFGHGGCPGTSTQDSELVHAFNPETNDWSRMEDLPSVNSHSEPGTFVYQGDIYKTGGETIKNKVWKYSPDSDQWSTFETLPEDLVAPVARIIDGRLIVAGGGAPVARRATNTVHSIEIESTPRVEEPAPISEPLPGSNTPEGPTLISMEAEYFDISTQTSTHQWEHVAIGNSSNDAAMITTPDQGELAATTESTPMLSYLVHFNYPGKHYIWVRGLGDTDASGEGNSDSIQIGLNGSLSSTAYRIDQFPDEWTWSRHTPSATAASLNVVDAGVNMVNLWMREDGLAIDKFVITSDPDFVPEGFGPEATDGTSDFVPPVRDDDSDTDPVSEGRVESVDVVDVVDVVTIVNDETSVDTSTEPRNDESGYDDSVSSSSSGGLFGGSASALVLLVLGLVWAGRRRPCRLAFG